MKTIRRYHNVAEADFACSLLKASGIEAVLFDENVAGSNYVLDPWGMRLQVPDADLENALEILTVQPEVGPAVDALPVTPETPPMPEETSGGELTANPYEILVFAAPFIIGGIILLLKKGQAAVVGFLGGRLLTIDPLGVHRIGIVALTFGAALIVFYFYLHLRLRKQIEKDHV